MPAVQFSDPEVEVAAILGAALGLPTQSEPGVAGNISTTYPSTTLTGTKATVQVELEGGNIADYPVTDRAQVRVTCHVAPSRRGAVKALADDCRRHLATFPGSATAAAVWPMTSRSAVSTDPATRNLMCWFLVRVDLKASLAS